ncbi:MAG: sigma-70 family RNA polymerase sigma factor [Geitlerinemataceae cyanobacterium]
MQVPSFPEANHSLVKTLFHYSDRELLTLYQRHPDEGKYFTAIFCRYSQIVYTLIQHSVKSPVQADYLFALIWRHIFHELRSLDIRQDEAITDEAAARSLSLQNWIINMTALCINQADLPPVESIRYSLTAAPPPLWCYLQQGLDMLPPRERLLVVMAQTFHWSEGRIAAYLQAEGDVISPAEVAQQLQPAYRTLEASLPEDIGMIYLNRNGVDSELSGELSAVGGSSAIANSP